MFLDYELYTVKQIRIIESHALSTVGESTLMARAGEAAFCVLKEQYPEAQAITVFAGAGNNGGDGFVIARLAKAQGMHVVVYTVGTMDKLSESAKQAYQALTTSGIEVCAFDGHVPLDESDVIIDALLGIGLSGEVRGDYVDAIQCINQSEVDVLAIDLPSGIDADTGRVLGVAVCATMTVTFIGMKQGLLTGQAVSYTGELFCNDLDLEEEIMTHPVTALRLDEGELTTLLPTREKHAHKGMLGHVLVIGGDEGMAGAARLSAEAALRVGAGKVSVATRAAHLSVILSGRPELMCHCIADATELNPLLAQADVCVIGPGLAESEWSESLIKMALKFKGPKVIDAGALLYLSKHPQFVENAIITPHPGEAARLLKVTNQEIQNERFSTVVSLVKQVAEIVVLKGAGTLVQATNAIPLVCDLGNPGMATAGMGDVLAGMIAGFVAQGSSNFDAAQCGVVLHAYAGDKAVAVHGEYALLAGDLFAYFSECMQVDSITYDWDDTSDE